ncbi:MAG TPA: RDD family protein [Kofleriaceae bacterium]|nr:RDD family protein [Kofleriaceae bacterium]
MSDREPALLGPSGEVRFEDDTTVETPVHTPHPTPPPGPAPVPTRLRREAPAVYVVGFWRRLVAAAIDLALVVPASLLIALLAGRITGLHMPSNLHLLDIDLWIDLVLATDPALVMALVLVAAIGLVYLLVFQIVVGRTLGMRVMGLKIIDVFGDPPSAGRCVARCAGYLAGVATLFLGFLWMGFDSEKRGLQDWIAGTYVIRA